MPLLAECTSLTKFKLVPENVLIPTHLDQSIPDDLRLDLNFLRISAGKAFRTMITVVRQRKNRYRALCPTEDKLRQSRHIATINRLRRWREDYDPCDPTLAPSQKIPHEIIYLHVSRSCYEEWERSYTNLLAAFINGPYQQYHLSAAEFELAILAARNRERISPVDYHELMVFYRTFMGEMSIWEEVIPRLGLPSYGEIVDELFEAVIERVENSERLFEAFQKAKYSGETAGRNTQGDTSTEDTSGEAIRGCGWDNL
ncbi:hypothetical protein BJY01DRAFT_246219 [Aspergillus pseudoustus]|uniref:Uncharacterized protein n=1 Tax=Aspergillus pseudoustus TaxID=1810923 RepID=A0ABR4K972_9EURO